MSASLWLLVILTGVSTFALKGAGPALLGGKSLPPRVDDQISMLGPALLAALVATQVLTDGQNLVVDARLAGIAAAGAALWLRMPPLIVIVAAAAVTASVRALT